MKIHPMPMPANCSVICRDDDPLLDHVSPSVAGNNNAPSAPPLGNFGSLPMKVPERLPLLHNAPKPPSLPIPIPA